MAFGTGSQIPIWSWCTRKDLAPDPFHLAYPHPHPVEALTAVILISCFDKVRSIKPYLEKHDAPVGHRFLHDKPWQAMTSHDLQIKMTTRGVMAAWPHLYIYDMSDMSLVVSAPGDWSSSPFSVGSASEVMPPPPPLTIHAVGATKLDSSSGPCTYDTGRHWQRIGNALATDPNWLSWSHSAKRMNIEKYWEEDRRGKG